jgi:DNA sulfur modification protein DndD
MGRTLGELEVRLQAVTAGHHDLAEIVAEVKSVGLLMSKSVAPRVSDIDAALRKYEIELTRVENEGEALEAEIRGYDTAEIARKRALRDGLLREEGHLTRDIEIVAKNIDTAKKELAIIARTLQNIPSARASRSTAMVEISSSLERIFSESIERLRDRLRKHVEDRASEAFMSLTTQKSYSGLEINKNYGLKILDERGGHVTVRSAGAEQIVALSLIDGLARTGRAAGPVVMDTPFGRLDLQHRDNILRYLPTTTSQLILLVHGGEMRRPQDLEPVASRIGASYEIKEVNSRHSKIERVAS